MEEYLAIDKDLNVIFCGTLDQIGNSMMFKPDVTEADMAKYAKVWNLTLYKIVE